VHVATVEFGDPKGVRYNTYQQPITPNFFLLFEETTAKGTQGLVQNGQALADVSL
jgi:hypothetical protein